MDEAEKVSRKLRSMKKYVDFLRKYRSTTEGELEKNDLLKSAIERNFQLAIESALDIGEVIISTRDFEKPEDYKDVIFILGKNKVIPTDCVKNKFNKQGSPPFQCNMADSIQEFS